MTGDEVKEARQFLLLSGAQFATLLGVEPTSVWRWEGHHKKVVRLDQHNRRMISGILRRSRDSSKKGRLNIGGRIAIELDTDGALVALRTLLDWIIGE